MLIKCHNCWLGCFCNAYAYTTDKGAVQRENALSHVGGVSREAGRLGKCCGGGHDGSLRYCCSAMLFTRVEVFLQKWC